MPCASDVVPPRVPRSSIRPVAGSPRKAWAGPSVCSREYPTTWPASLIACPYAALPVPSATSQVTCPVATSQTKGRIAEYIPPPVPTT